MAIFGGKKKKDDFNPNDFEIKEEVYDDFEGAIADLIGQGSRDIKKLDILLKNGDQMYVLVENSKISFAYNENKPLQLSSRFYWVDQGIANDAEVQSILHTSGGNYSEIFNRIKDYVPTYSDKIDEVYRSYTVSTLLEAREIGIKRLFVDMMIDSATVKMVQRSSFISINPQGLGELLNFAERAAVIAYAPISSSNYDEVTLYLNEEAVSNGDGTRRALVIDDGETDAERFVIAAAEARQNLIGLKDNSSGFEWQSILQAVSNLVYDNKVEIDDQGEEEEEFSIPYEEPEDLNLAEIELESDDEEYEEILEKELEELGTLEDDKDALEDDVTFAGASSGFKVNWGDLSTDEDDEEEAFDESLVEGSAFDSGVIDTDEALDYTTPGLGGNLVEEIEEIFATSAAGFSGHVAATYAEVLEAATLNNKLEEDVQRQDEVISLRIQEYVNGNVDFDAKALEIGVTDGTMTGEIADEARPLETEQTTILHQQLEDYRRESNARFFNIESIEASRFMKNKTRTSILSGISEDLGTVLSYANDSVDTFRVEAVHELITEKLRGIEAVKNKALHLESDDKDVADEASPLFFNAEDINIESSPIFTQLAKDLDIDIKRLKETNVVFDHKHI